MYFKLSASQENDLLNQPETGMGYQVVEASKAGSYTREKFLVLNSEVVIEMNTSTNDNVRKVIHEGIYSIKASANYITLNAISVFNEKQFRNIVNESKDENEKGGGGKEAYFAKGTAAGTFLKQTSY